MTEVGDLVIVLKDFVNSGEGAIHKITGVHGTNYTLYGIDAEFTGSNLFNLSKLKLNNKEEIEDFIYVSHDLIKSVKVKTKIRSGSSINKISISLEDNGKVYKIELSDPRTKYGMLIDYLQDYYE